MRPGVSKPGDWRAGFHLSGCGEKFQIWKFRKTLRKSARRKWDAYVCTCTIITGEPNDLVAQIHTRIPVILARNIMRPG